MITAMQDWVDRGQDTLDPVDRARVRVQHLVVALMQIIGLPYAAVFLWLGLPVSAAVNATVFLGSLGLLFGLTRRGHHRLGGCAISVAFFATISVALIARGGMTSNSAAWLLLSPVLAFLMVGPRHGMLIGVVTAVEFVTLWLAEELGMPLPAGLPPDLAHLMIPVDYGVIAVTISMILWTLAGIWDSVIERIDQANQTLTTEVDVRIRAEEEALSAARARYTFLATMSHEIRTPLNGVLGLTEIMLHGELQPDQRELATTVHHSGQLLRTLLDDVLDFSKIDSGQLELEAVAVDLRGVCTELVRLWKDPAHESGLELAAFFDDDVPDWIIGDATRLRQILGNLLSNAVKFTQRGHIHLRVQRDQDSLVIEVDDTGLGIASDALAHIFEPFRQADASTTRTHGGTGLGLSICRRLATAMRGELTVRSELGSGTTFTLRLPLVPADAPTSHGDEAIDLTPLPGARVLVAEDNAVNQMVVRKLLERYQIDVVVVADGLQAVQAWQPGGFDLVLMDCQMPVVDGYEATRRLRALGARVPIVALTANTMPGDRARCLQAGMDDHLGKPVRVPELESALARWIAPQRRAAEAG